MALIDFTGFDYQLASTMPFYFFTYSASGASYVSYTTSTRFSTGRAFYWTANYSDLYIYKALAQDYSSLIVGFAAKLINQDTSPVFNIFFGNSVETRQCQVVFNLNLGYVQLYRYNTVVLGTSNNNTFIPVDWNYYEIKMVLGNGDGSCIVKINGSEVLNLTNVDNIYTGTDTNINVFGLQLNDSEMYLDDFYVLDETGSTNNTFLGDVTVSPLMPTANGTTNDGTASSGSNYECVDEIDYNDSDYVTLDAINEIELYTMEDLPSTSYTKTIYGVKSVARLDKISGGVRGNVPIVRVNSTDYPHSGSTYYISSGYSYMTSFIWELNPDDSAAWEESDINAMEAGIKVTL